MKDIILTWPKDRSLESYLEELERARRANEVINFRVSRPPKDAIRSENQVSVSFVGVPQQPKCYMVHDGFVRGFNKVLAVTYRGAGEVIDPISGVAWPAGWYIVRTPKWYPIVPVRMRGFQGFRYAENVEGLNLP